MKILRRLNKIQLVGLVATVPLLIGGTVFAYNIATPPDSKPVNDTTINEQSTTPNKVDRQTNDSDTIDETPQDQTASESTTNTSAQSSLQTPTTNTTRPTETTTTAPQQTATNPTPATPTCNESMKLSYTNLYNSNVSAENASWNNQIAAWQVDAQRRGLGFSGYVQGMINDNKPAHDARLAQLQTQYYQNLASINCNT
ncbi:hypothetical protein KC874_01585 [Candidatus Saccharibacteria bacterium]|nr:hypothetical protein [Candidatus Saccharibacteria bacterium]